MRESGGWLRVVLRVTLILEVQFTDKRNGHVSGMLISTKKGDTCRFDVMIPLYKIDIGLAALPCPCQVVNGEVTKYVTMSPSTVLDILCPLHNIHMPRPLISLTLSYNNLLVSIRLGPRNIALHRPHTQ